MHCNLIGTISLSALLLIGCQSSEEQDKQDIADGVTMSVPSVATKRTCVEDDFLPYGRDMTSWPESWNTDAPTEQISLHRPDKGMSIMIPYNSSWGSVDCQLSKYDEIENRIHFGYAHIFEGGGAGRFNLISFEPQRPTEKAIAEITEMQKADKERGMIEAYAEPTAITINDNTVIRYGTNGFCNETYYEVIGKTMNYLFRSTCNIDQEGSMAALESLTLSE